MEEKYVISRQTRAVIETAKGRSLHVHLKPELLDLNLGKGDEVVVTLIENARKEKQIIIEKMTERA